MREPSAEEIVADIRRQRHLYQLCPRAQEERIEELLRTNNQYLERARSAEAALKQAQDELAFLKGAYLAAYTQFTASLGAALHIKELK